MEVAGLAIGIAGLAGLFASCLDSIEKIQSYRSSKIDASGLNAQFEAEKLRLEKWGLDVGFDASAPSARTNHHPALDEAKTIKAVRELLLIIESIRNIERPESTRKKVAWAVWGKEKSADQVRLLRDLVQCLYDLVPPGRPQRLSEEQDEANSIALESVLGTHLRTLELPQTLARLNKVITTETRRELRSWLMGRHLPNERYDDSIQRRLDGTCNWILERPEFLHWASSDFPDSKPKILWINGPPGYGKTVLCARVIEHLKATTETDPTPLAYFFFSSDFESREDPLAAIRSWMCQAAAQDQGVFDLIRQKWDQAEDQVASRTDVVNLFREIFLRPSLRCILVLDGLDECSPRDTCISVADCLELVTQSISGSNTRLLVVSRDNHEIRRGLTDVAATKAAEYRIADEDVRADNASYAGAIVDKQLPNKSQLVRTEIAERMTDRCKGQFLWLKLQGDSINGGLNRKQLIRTVEDTPVELTGLYDQNWAQIDRLPAYSRSRAISLLRLAAFTFRPLTVCEITEAVLVYDECDEFPVDELPDSWDDVYVQTQILGLCGSLLEIRSQ
ncbi:hypothetical protein B0T10DRAFT_197799, partial [Thelonectria olida]